MTTRTDIDLSRTPLSGWAILVGYSAAVAIASVVADRLRSKVAGRGQ